jgi:hypothetical protein
LKDEELPVRLRAIRGLGRIGTRSSLPALDRQDADPGTREAKELALARTLIAYREGVDRDDIEFVLGKRRRPGDPDQMLPLQLRTTTSKLVRDAVADLGSHPYGIDLADEIAFDIRIGDAQWLLALNRQAIGSSVIPEVTRRRLVAGLMLRLAPAVDSYAVQHIVFTRPAGGALAEILVLRTDGELMYSGRAETSDGVLGFELRDIDRAATAPMRVDGRLTSSGFELETAILFGDRRHKRRAQAESTRVLSRAELKK